MALLQDELTIMIGADTSGLKRGIVDARSNIDLMTGQSRKLGNELKTAADKGSSSFKELRSSLLFVRSNIMLLTAAAVALGAPILKADDAFKEFDATLQYAGGSLTNSREKLSKLASTMGDTFWSATDKAKAALVQFSGDAPKAMKAAELAARGAALGIYTEQEAMSALVPVAKAFNQETGQLERAFAILNRGAMDSGVTIGEFSGALVELARPALQGGVALDEVAAGLMTLSTAGVRPADAIGVIESVLRAAKSPTEEQAEALDKLAINYSNLGSLAGGGLGTSLNAITTAIANGNEPLVAAALGSEQLAAAFGNAAGSIQPFAVSFNALNGAVAEFNSAYQNSLSLLDKSKSTLNDAASWWANLASKIQEANNAQGRKIADLDSTGKALQYDLMGFGSPKALGGPIGGVGVGDSVHAMLTPGEFVVKKDVAQKMMPFLSRLNAGGIDPAALWNSPAAGLRVGGEWLLQMLGIPQTTGYQRGFMVHESSDKNRLLSEIAFGMRKEALGFAQGGPVPAASQGQNTTIQGGVNINLNGASWTQADIERNLMPAIERAVNASRSRHKRTGR